MINKNKNLLNISLVLLTFSIYLGQFNFDLGFSLKPFILITFLISFALNFKLFFKKFNIFDSLLLIFIIMFSLSVVQMRYPKENLLYFFAIINSLFLFLVTRYLVIKTDINKFISNFSKIAFYIILLNFIYYLIGIISINFNFNHVNGIYFGLMIERGIPRMIGFISFDPNILVLFLTPYLFYSLLHFKYNKRNKFGFFITLFSVTLTFSRGGIIAILITIFIYIIKNINLKSLITIVFSGFVALFVITMINNYSSFNIIEILTLRFSNLFSSNGSGRIIIWKNAIEIFKTHPIFGIGINSFLPYSKEFYGMDFYVHNTYLEVLVEGGIFIFILFFIFIINLFYNIIKNRSSRFSFLNFSLIAILIQIFFLSALYNEMIYFVFGIYSGILYNKTNNINKDYELQKEICYE